MTTVANLPGRNRLKANGNWRLSTEARRSGDGEVRPFDVVAESADEGVIYFSGTATYRKTVEIPRGFWLGQRIILDLGTVKISPRCR